ncbi:hypothetical protein AB0I55_29460 [Actinocatenispora sera]|uniref:Excreted virulence factor EspC (Type VII ESX diderm) n=1 Tax=Actinocatenispora sera TaxID=390989 RepID=A0A810KWP6_9ACTN|nr:hypothetical protein [Actinocatenispora sera]BCJ26498.1 hypothetical protein Asera_06060 [Actinocatenispora sera]
MGESGSVGLGTFGGRLIAAAGRMRAATGPDTGSAPACCAAPGSLGDLAADLHRRWGVAAWQAHDATDRAADRLTDLGTDLGTAAARYRDADQQAAQAIRRAGEPR